MQNLIYFLLFLSDTVARECSKEDRAEEFRQIGLETIARREGMTAEQLILLGKIRKMGSDPGLLGEEEMPSWNIKNHTIVLPPGMTDEELFEIFRKYDLPEPECGNYSKHPSGQKIPVGYQFRYANGYFTVWLKRCHSR